MAEKKKKTIASRATNSAKNSSKKNTDTAKEQSNSEQKIPARLISATAFLGLFVLFIILFYFLVPWEYTGLFLMDIYRTCTSFE